MHFYDLFLSIAQKSCFELPAKLKQQEGVAWHGDYYTK